MVQSESRFTPQHQSWIEDLPLREATAEGEALLGGLLISMDESGLKISRATNVLRGVALMGGMILSVGACLLGSLVTGLLQVSLQSEYVRIEHVVGGIGLLLIDVFLLAPMAWWGIRLDCCMPRDTPIRFSRKTGKVQAFEYSWTWNPFGRWPLQHKEFDWSDVQAEVQRQAGTDGRSYVIRYALVRCICRPETFEVIDRITLKSNRIGSSDFPQIWNYLRRYMLDGPADLIAPRPVRQDVSFRRSLFKYMRNLDPTQEGKDYRAESPWWLSVVNGVMVLLAFWVIIPMGVCHYVAVRLAPVAKWPVEGESARCEPSTGSFSI